MAEINTKAGKAVFIVLMIVVAAISAFEIVRAFKKPVGISEDNPDQLWKDFEAPSSNVPFFSKKKSSLPKLTGQEYIAELHIEGVIQSENQMYNQLWLLKTIRTLKKDTNNKAIVLFIDSPGGSVYETDEVYLELLDYKKSGRPVYAYLASLAASGGYYIACAADYIMANRNTLTGSIGVIAGSSMDMTKLMENLGIRYTTIHAGKNKNMGNVNEPFTEEQQQIMQEIADECYRQFTGIVAKSRKLPLAEVEVLADGRIYTAQQASFKHLIDNIGSKQSLINYLQNKELLGKDFDVVEFSYKPSKNFYDFLRGAVRELSPAANANSLIPETVQKVIAPGIQYPAYYYSAQLR